MLSLQRCRSLIGTDCNLTDAQVEQLRQELYAFSEVALAAFSAQKPEPKRGGSKERSVSPLLSQVPELERPQVEERAAILEYDGGRTRSEAERQAFGEWVQSKRPARLDQKQRRNNSRRSRKSRLTKKQ